MSVPTEAPPIQLADLWAMVRRRAVLALAAAVAAFVAVLSLPNLVLPTLYRAEATLTMDRGLKVVSFQNDQLAGLVPDQMVNTQRELLASQAVLEDALALGGFLANRAYAQAPDAVALLRKRLRTSVVKNSWVISVSLDDEDPERAQAGLQSVLDAFLAHQNAEASQRRDADLAFVESQLANAKAKLETSRNEERTFRAEYGIASSDPDRNHITARIQTLAEGQAALDGRVAASGALLGQIEAADAIEDPKARLAAYLRIDTISTFTVVGSLQQELFALEGTEAELSVKYLDKHPKLIEIRSHIAAKRSQLEATITAARAAIEADHAVLVEQRAALVRSQAELRRELNEYRERLVDLLRMEMESQAQQKVHDELLARRAQLTATAGYDERRMIVSAPPRSSPVARGVGTVPLLALATLAAAAAALATAAMADSIDPTVRDARQVADLTRLRNLGQIPAIAKLPLIARSGPAEPGEMIEAMRTLWAGLRFAFGQRADSNVVLVASPCEGDGRSTVAARLAAGLAMAGSRVLLVDADLRHPTQAAQFGLVEGDGFAQLLGGMPDLAPMATGIPNLDLMPSGGTPGNPGELLNSHCLPEWMGTVRRQYDAVILDSPALDACADALLLGAQVDGILLVIRAGRTGRSALHAAWERLEPLRQRILGSTIIASGADGDGA